MRTNFYEFITESKNYPIYKGVSDLKSILNSGVIKYSGNWDSNIRKNMGIKSGYGISVTRFFSTAISYGVVLELDTQKISDNYKIIPFSENPDFYLWYQGSGWNHNIKSKPEISTDLKHKNWDSLKKALHSPNGKEYWDYKTNKNSSDFQIAEEVIIAKEIPIKYIKKVYFKPYYYNANLANMLDEKGIPYELDDSKSKYLTKFKYKKKKDLAII